MEVADENYQHEQRNRLKSASGSDVLDHAASAVAPDVGTSSTRLRGSRAPSEPLDPPRKNSAVGRIPDYLGEPISAQMLDIKEEQESSSAPLDVRTRFRDPKAANLARDEPSDDLMSFDDDYAFDDEDDDAFVDKDSSSSPKEPSIDSCIDALEHVQPSNDSVQNVNTQPQPLTHDASQTNTEPSNATATTSASTENVAKTPHTYKQQVSEEFEVVTSSDVTNAIRTEKNAALQALLGGAAAHARRRRKLRDGFRWQKQLVFRYKLTMHTAFERKDNTNPAPVTAIATSRSVQNQSFCHIFVPNLLRGMFACLFSDFYERLVGR